MIREVEIQEGFTVIKISQDSDNQEVYQKSINSDFIQMHFCLGGKSELRYGPHYSRFLAENSSTMLYNPDEALPIDLVSTESGKHLIFVVAIKVFHSFFSQIAEMIPFLDEENIHKKYYLEKQLEPSEILVLNQIFEEQKQNSIQKLYLKAKAFETLSLYFGENEDNDQPCPFLNSEENVDKIKRVKQIVIANMAEPPTLQELADEVGITLSKLKEGFKHIYGESVFNFLFDYKMEFARKQLLSGEYNVSEISLQLGYSTASHFISAFKKKYGTTPKQYVLSSN